MMKTLRIIPLFLTLVFLTPAMGADLSGILKLPTAQGGPRDASFVCTGGVGGAASPSGNRLRSDGGADPCKGYSGSYTKCLACYVWKDEKACAALSH